MPGKIGGEGSSLPFKDSAQTFTESDVSLSGSNYTLKSGSVHIGNRDSVSYTYDSYRSKDEGGLVINPNESLSAIRVDVADDSTAQETFDNGLAIRDGVGGPIIASTSGPVKPGDSITLSASLSAGTSYAVVLRDSSGSPQLANNSNDATVSSAAFDVEDGVRSDNRVDAPHAFETIAVPASSATAYVNWPMPPDVFDWYVSKYQTTPDGGTVDVHVEEQQSDGWTPIAGPIKRGDSIPADPANNVRFRIELSRTDLSSNTALDSILRSFTR